LDQIGAKKSTQKERKIMDRLPLAFLGFLFVYLIWDDLALALLVALIILLVLKDNHG